MASTATISMDQLENVASFQKLVQHFNRKPPAVDQKKTNMSRSNEVIIATRIRPLLEHEEAEGQVEGVVPRYGTTAVDLHSMQLGLPGGPKLRSSEFYLDRVYGPEKTTEEIYDEIAAPLVELALNGGIGTLFAYGQTGSGKTFTVSGIEKIIADKIIRREFLGERNVHVSINELGGTLNSAFDLLNNRKPVSILEDSFGETHFVGATETRVHRAKDFHELIDTASQFRRTSATEKNEQSSRSHAICKITITDPVTRAAPEGVLFLVDLAGSEAAQDVVNHATERMKETRDINVSLSVLKDCIRGRAQAGSEKGKKAYVPFRQSALTKTLKHLFDPTAGRDCKMSVVACINPSFLDVGASKNTLRYAEMLRVPVAMSKPLIFNENIPSTWNNTQLKKWISENSGSPPIDAELLAPYHTGVQLLKMPEEEFKQRCIKTEEVSREQVGAFYSRFWQKHVDASNYTNGSKSKGDEFDQYKESSAVPKDVAKVPFKQRIRPGMVVKYKPSKPTGLDFNMATILCPDWAVETHVKDWQGNEVVVATGGPKRYLCGLVSPGLLPDSYQVSIWRQAVIAVEDMEAEVTLEYDQAMRYYFIDV